MRVLHGDALLVEFTNRLRGQLQPLDMLGRISGDEFVVVLPNCDPARASQIASNITAALATPLWFENRQVPISESSRIRASGTYVLFRKFPRL